MTAQSPDAKRLRRRLATAAAVAPFAMDWAAAQTSTVDERLDAPVQFDAPPPLRSADGAGGSSLGGLAAGEASTGFDLLREQPLPSEAPRQAGVLRVAQASAVGDAPPTSRPAAEVARPSETSTGVPPPEEETVLFEADVVTRESEDGPIVAEGDVRAYFGARFLTADRLVYDPAKDIVYAEGDVSITDETRETAFAGRVQLTGDLRDGVASNFSALLAENARVAAESAVREQGARTRFRKAVYTACEVCNDESEGKTPTWRIKALKVVRDEERQVVRFHNAFLELKGVPILYTPYLQGPDPAVERQSGFLSPQVGADTRIGFNLELPYYFAISNTEDATFAPRYTSKDGVLWQGEYRRRDDSAFNVISGGLIDFDNFADDPDAPQLRWHVFAKGVREFGPNLRAGYDVERVSDDLYLRRYNVLRRGDLRKDLDTTQANRLTSTGYVDYDDGTQSVRAEAFVFQELTARPDGFDELTPFVLPRIDYERRGWKVAGGEAYMRANLTALQRGAGLDSRRLTAAVGWEREEVTKGGHRFRAFAEARGDVVSYDDIDGGTEATGGAALAGFDPGETSDLVGRFAPTVGVEWSYPLVRHTPGLTLMIEPRVQLVASLAGLNDPDFINEDSRSIEFDYAGLFETNKSPGFDAFEDGQRANIGLFASATTAGGLNVSGEIGQQFRLQETLAFTPDRVAGGTASEANGIGREQSDIVGELNIRYRNFVGVESRFRLDDGFGSLNRVDALAYLNLWKFRSSATYTRVSDEDPTVGLTRREEFTPSVVFQIDDNWRTQYSFRQDLENDLLINQTIGFGYQDECALFEVAYTRDRTTDRSLPRNDSFVFRFTLRTLVE